MKDKPHEHVFKLTTKTVLLHNYVIERGKIVKDLIAGKDTLKQFVCKCGKTETTDLERKLV